MISMNEAKRCPRCDAIKSFEDFGNSKQNKDGKNGWCLVCCREVSKAYRGTVAGIYQNIKGRQTFYKKHGHWRYKPVTLTKDEFISWWNLQEPRCFYCKIHKDELSLVDDTQNTKATRLTVDCIENRLGYSLDNMVLACGRCNFIKSDFFTHIEMIEIGKTYVSDKWKSMLEQSITEEGN